MQLLRLLDGNPLYYGRYLTDVIDIVKESNNSELTEYAMKKTIENKRIGRSMKDLDNKISTRKKKIVILVHPFFGRYYPGSYIPLYKHLNKKEFLARLIKYEHKLASFLKHLSDDTGLILFEERKRIKSTLKRLAKFGIVPDSVVPTYPASGEPLNDRSFKKFANRLKSAGIKRVRLCGSYYAKRSRMSKEQQKILKNRDEHVHCVGHVFEGLSDNNIKPIVVRKAVLDLTRRR